MGVKGAPTDGCVLCRLQAIVAKVALGVHVLPVEWGEEKVWMTGRLLCTRLGWELVTQAKREMAEQGVYWVGGQCGACGCARVQSGCRDSEKHEAGPVQP